VGEHGTITLPSYKNSRGINVVFAFQFFKQVLHEVHVVDARGPRASAAVVSTAVVARGRSVGETSIVCCCHAIVHEAGVPSDVVLAVLAVEVSVASGEQRYKVIFLS